MSEFLVLALHTDIFFSSVDTTQLILQTLLTLVSQTEGAVEFLKVEDLSPLTEIAPDTSLVLDIFDLAWANASTVTDEVPIVKASINNVIPALLLVFKGTDAVTLLSAIGTSMTKIKVEVSVST